MRYARLLIAKLILFAITPVMAEQAHPLPDAAYMNAAIVHNTPSEAPRAPRTIDKGFLISHAIYLGAIGYDAAQTSKGLGQPCGMAEGGAYGAKTSGGMIRNSLLEFAAVTAMDYLLKRTKVPVLGYVGASVGTAKHIRGGIMWAQTGCF